MSIKILQRNKKVGAVFQATKSIDGMGLPNDRAWANSVFYLRTEAQCAILKDNALPILLYYPFSSPPAKPHCRLTSTMNERQQNRQFAIFGWVGHFLPRSLLDDRQAVVKPCTDGGVHGSRKSRLAMV